MRPCHSGGPPRLSTGESIVAFWLQPSLTTRPSCAPSRRSPTRLSLRRYGAESTKPDAEVIAVELPVGSDLLGSGWIRIVVEAPLEIRLARAAGRGMTEDDARRRIAAQPSAEQWRSGAAYVMVNDGTLADLMQVVDELWMKLQGLLASRAPARAGRKPTGWTPGNGSQHPTRASRAVPVRNRWATPRQACHTSLCTL